MSRGRRPGPRPGRWDMRIAPLEVNGEAQGVHLVCEDISDRTSCACASAGSTAS